MKVLLLYYKSLVCSYISNGRAWEKYLLYFSMQELWKWENHRVLYPNSSTGISWLPNLRKLHKICTLSYKGIQPSCQVSSFQCTEKLCFILFNSVMSMISWECMMFWEIGRQFRYICMILFYLDYYIDRTQT